MQNGLVTIKSLITLVIPSNFSAHLVMYFIPYLVIIFGVIRLVLQLIDCRQRRERGCTKELRGTKEVCISNGSVYVTEKKKVERASTVDPLVIGNRSQTIKFLTEYPSFLHASDVEILINPLMNDYRAWWDSNLLEILPRLDLSQFLNCKNDSAMILEVLHHFSKRYSKNPMISLLIQLQLELFVELSDGDKTIFTKFVDSRRDFLEKYSHTPFMQKVLHLMKIPLSSMVEAKLRSEKIYDVLDTSTTHDYLDVMAAYDVLIESTKVNHFGEYVMLRQLVLLCLSGRVCLSSNRWVQNCWLNSVLEIYSSLGANLQYFLILMTTHFKEFIYVHSLLVNSKTDVIVEAFRRTSEKRLDVLHVLEPSPYYFFLYLTSLVDVLQWKEVTENVKFLQTPMTFPIKGASEAVYLQLGATIALNMITVIVNKKYDVKEIDVDQSLAAFILNLDHLINESSSLTPLRRFIRSPTYNIAVCVRGSARSYLKNTFGEVILYPAVSKTIVSFFSPDMIKLRMAEEKLCSEKHQKELDNADDIRFPSDYHIQTWIRNRYIYSSNASIYGIGLELDDIGSVAQAIVQLIRYGSLPENNNYQVAKEFLEPFKAKFTDIEVDEVLRTVFPFMNQSLDNPRKNKNVIFSKLSFLKGDGMKENLKHLMRTYFYRLKYLVHTIELKHVHSIERVNKSVSKAILDFSIESIKKGFKDNNSSQSLYHLLSEHTPFLKCLDSESLLHVGKCLFKSENTQQLLFNYSIAIKDEVVPESGALQNFKAMRLRGYQEIIRDTSEFDLQHLVKAMVSVCLCRSSLILDEEEHMFVYEQVVFRKLSLPTSLHEPLTSAYYSFAVKHFKANIVVDLLCRNERIYDVFFKEALFLEPSRTKKLVEVALKNNSIPSKVLLTLGFNSAFWSIAERDPQDAERWFRDDRNRDQLTHLLKEPLSGYAEQFLSALNIPKECFPDSNIAANDLQSKIIVDFDFEDGNDQSLTSESEKANEDDEKALIPDAEKPPLDEPLQIQDEPECREVKFIQTEIKPIESLFDFTEEGYAIPKANIAIEDISRIFKVIHYRSEGFPFLLDPLFYSWTSNYDFEEVATLDYSPWYPSEQWEEIKRTYFFKGLNCSKLWDCRVHPIKLEASCPKYCAAAIGSLNGKVLARLQSLMFYSQKSGQRKQDLLVQYQFTDNTNQVRIEIGTLFIDKSLTSVELIHDAISQKLCDESIDNIVQVRKISKKPPNEEVISVSHHEQEPLIEKNSFTDAKLENSEWKGEKLLLIDNNQKPNNLILSIPDLNISKKKDEGKAPLKVSEPIRPNAPRMKKRQEIKKERKLNEGSYESTNITPHTKSNFSPESMEFVPSSFSNSSVSILNSMELLKQATLSPRLSKCLHSEKSALAHYYSFTELLESNNIAQFRKKVTHWNMTNMRLMVETLKHASFVALKGKYRKIRRGAYSDPFQKNTYAVMRPQDLQLDLTFIMSDSSKKIYVSLWRIDLENDTENSKKILSNYSDSMKDQKDLLQMPNFGNSFVFFKMLYEELQKRTLLLFSDSFKIDLLLLAKYGADVDVAQFQDLTELLTFLNGFINIQVIPDKVPKGDKWLISKLGPQRTSVTIALLFALSQQSY